ncbi:hypothetical protein HK102_012298, partial [Quaeritorhiza haematococci]
PIRVSPSSVVEVLDLFLLWCRRNRAPRTFDAYRDFCQLLLDAIPKGLAVAELRPYHLTAVMDARDWSPNTKHDFVTTIKRALNWAAAEGLIPSSPIDRMAKPPREARELAAAPPEALLVFSDVGSGVAMPLCRRKGVATVLSMVHGDVREEARLLEVEEALAPEFFPLYLGDAALDREEMDWLHARRLRDLELADLILVPSEHIAGTLEREGIPRDRLRVIPYAADCRRFRPLSGKRVEDGSCTFLFAGGVSQRKGIKYLLEAWARIRRPGWRLQLLGPMPRRLGPIEGMLEGVEPLGRVGHPEVPAHMASADVFVFPSLFEGSAVVTYEALACGLPAVVTPEAGSVVRDGVEGLEVASRDVDALAAAMARLGEDPALRARMGAAARSRAMDFD